MVAVVGLLIAAASARAQTTDVALGIEALARRDVAGAEAAFRRGTMAANPLVHSAAWQWLGHVAWKFRGNHPAAAAHFQRALAEARDSSPVLLEVARMQADRRRYRDAVATAYQAMRRSVDAERRGHAARTLSEIALDAAFPAKQLHLADSLDLKVIAEVRDTMASRVRRFPGRAGDALGLINLAVVLDDSVGILDGLSSYTALISDSLRPRPPEVTPWIPQRLHGARLFEQVAVFVKAAGLAGASDSLADAVSYGTWLHDLRRSLAGVYRREVAGAARPGDVTRLVNAEGRKLWAGFYWGNDEPGAYVPAQLGRELRRRFGTIISVERSRGMDELYLAHVIDPARLEGMKGVVLLDGVVAGGIDDWFLDGTGGRAAWADGDHIYARRLSFVETPFRAWLALTDPQTMPGEMLRISRDSIGDLQRARTDSLGYLPGVAARVFRDGARQLLDSTGDPVKFTRALHDALLTSSLELHERRHLLDARARPGQSQAEAEFRAKLDEVADAPHPKLSMTAILAPTIGDASPHGQANRRVMAGLARWIRRNGAAIPGYDVTQPALLQLPLLSDAQLRAAFDSMRRP